MASIATLTLKGVSGKSYTFDVYSIPIEFRVVGGIYIFSKRGKSSPPTNNFSHDIIYIGMTGDLSTRFNNHHKEEEIKGCNANCISILIEENEARRCEIEEDLIRQYQPPCNDTFTD